MIQVLSAPWTYLLHLPLSFVILIDSFTGSPVHILTIQAVCRLPHLHTPGIVPCIISSPSISVVSTVIVHHTLAFQGTVYRKLRNDAKQ